jgi:hypothetical protein
MFGKIVIVNNELMKNKNGHLNPKHLKKKKKEREKEIERYKEKERAKEKEKKR